MNAMNKSRLLSYTQLLRASFLGGALLLFSPTASAESTPASSTPLAKKQFPSQSTPTPIANMAPPLLPRKIHSDAQEKNHELYLLSYQVFLGNRNVQDAYQVAKTAVANFPKDLKWRERLARSALWSQHPRESLKQWTYLLKQSPDPKIRAEAIKHMTLAGVQLHDYPKVILAQLTKLETSPNDKDAWRLLVDMYELQGTPEQAIPLLKAANKRYPDKFYLDLLAKLYHNMNNPNEELATLKNIDKQYGTTPDSALKQATVLYNQNKLKDALSTLVKTESVAKPDDIVYWRTLSDLAWLMQDNPQALAASLTLYGQGQASVDDYYRLIELMSNRNPRQAYSLAEEGWVRFSQTNFFIYMLNLASQLGEWESLRDNYLALSPKTQKELSGSSSFWPGIAQMWLQLGERAKAERAILTAIDHYPSMAQYKADYLWMLIDLQDEFSLRTYLNRWKHLIPQENILMDPFATGFLQIKEPEQAQAILDYQWPKKQSDYLWLLNYADNIELSDLAREAYTIRRYVLKQLQNLLETNPTAFNQEDADLYARVAAELDNGDLVDVAMSKIAQPLHNTDSGILLLTWSVNEAYDNLANELYNVYQSSIVDLPPFITLNIQQMNNFHQPMQETLDRHGDQIEHSDRAEAEQQLNNGRLAAYHAYQAIDNEPLSGEARDSMHELMLAQANYIDLGERFIQNGSILGFETLLKAAKKVTPGITLMPYLKIRPQHSTDATDITNVPATDQTYGLNTQFQQTRGNTIIGIGYREALDNFVTAHITNTYRWTNQLTSIMKLGYNQEADESSALFVGGAKDVASIDLSYQVDDRNQLDTQFEGNRYYDQERNQLGNGFIFSGQYAYQVRFGYPDIRVTVGTSLYQYNTDNNPSGDALTLIPAGQSPTANFYVPESSNQYTLGWEIGEGSRDVYTHAWRPFASGSFFYDTVSYTGYSLNLGIGGSVFGRDKLTLSADQSLNSGGVSQTDRLVAIRYRYYF